MKRTACVASVLAVLIMAARADDSTPSIKEIMGKLHKGNNAPLAKLKTALKRNTPDWKGRPGLEQGLREPGGRPGQE